MTAESAKVTAHVQTEMALHVDYCRGFGISKNEMEAAEESEGMHGTSHVGWLLTERVACTAYTRLENRIPKSQAYV